MIGGPKERLLRAQEIIETLEEELRHADRGLIALTAELEARAAALEESEARFRLMVEGSEQVFFYTHDRDGTFTYLSPSVQTVLGYEPGNLLGESYDALLTEHPENAAVASRTADALKSGQRSPPYTAFVRHQGGGDVCLEIVEQPVVLYGEVTGMQGFARDVTESKRRQDALRETTRLVNALIDASPAAIYVLDRDGRVELWNPAAERLFGWSAVEVLGNELPTAGAQQEEFAALMRRSLEGVAFSALELRRARKDGALIDINVSTAPLPTGEGEVDGIVVVVVDVTEKKNAERALVRSEERYRLLFEEDLTGDFITRPDGRLVACNAAFVRMFGYASVEDALERGITPIYPDPAQREEVLAHVREHRALSAVEAEFRSLDGAPVHAIGSIYGVFDEDDQLTELRGHLLDVTEKKLLEEQLLRAQKMEAIGRLAGGVAHDFNNVLTAIRGHADFALDYVEAGSPAREDLEEVRRSADRAAGLTRQLLAFSRQHVVQPRVVDVAAEVREAEKMLRRIIGEDIDVATRLVDGCVLIDAGQLHQVIMNLVVNARDAMPGGGRIAIEAAPASLDEDEAAAALIDPGEYMVLSVRDTGEGMDAATRQHIFEPFFTTKEAGKGTGLGLATVYGIVTNAGGEIRVTSEPGVGTTFDVYLPRVLEPADPKVAGEAGLRPADEAAPESATIIVVEDEASVRMLVTRILKRHGYEVLDVGDAQEALRLFQDRHADVDLVLSDVVMPGMSGRELVTAMREIRPDLPLMFMSGYTRDEVVRRGVTEDGVLFVEKPFSPASLLEAVENALAQARNEASDGP